MIESTGSSLPAAAEPRLQAAVLAGITVLVFAPTLSSGFVYDARLQILTDPFLHDPGNWWAVLTFGTLSMDVLDFNRPVNLASLMLDAAVWGQQAFGYHLTSVLLHALNVVLAWAVLRRLTREFSAAAAMVGPLLFAVHPVVTEAVCEPTFREDLLVACFTLAGLLLAMGHRPGGQGRDGWRAAGVAACALLAIGSKESGIAAPAVLAGYRLACRRGERGAFWPAAIGGATLVTLAFLGARFLLEPNPSRIFESRPQYPGGSLAAAMLVELRILALYSQLLILPVNLCADYGPYSVRHLPLPVAVLVVSAVITAAVAAVRTDRRMAVPVAIVVASLLPVANLIPIYRAAADRYLYLTAAGVALAAGLFLDASWLDRREGLRDRFVIACAGAAILLGIGCTHRQRVWADQLHLWVDTFRKNPASHFAACGLASAWREAGSFAEAEQAARQAILLTDGKQADAWLELALALDRQERSKEASEALEKALEIDPKLADPDDRVAALAMDQATADDLKSLQIRYRVSR